MKPVNLKKHKKQDADFESIQDDDEASLILQKEMEDKMLMKWKINISFI